jgi:pimeloyl-ACP methyl ester carboxylesterase
LRKEGGDVRHERFAGLAGDESGNDDTTAPLVLLHGLTFDRTMWSPAIAELRAVDPDRRVLALDLPGHGASVDRSSYAMEEVVEHVHRAVEQAGVSAPVLVGHSIAGVIATVYAARHPTRGVVNVDQHLRVERFAGRVRSLADRLEGPAFGEVWQMFWASMQTEVLPHSAQALLRATSRPRRDLVVGYWRDVLERPVAELASFAASALEGVRAAAIPYLIVTGEELDPHYRHWLKAALPRVRARVLPRSGHFPHLAHPEQFAGYMAATAAWSRTDSLMATP